MLRKKRIRRNKGEVDCTRFFRFFRRLPLGLRLVTTSVSELSIPQHNKFPLTLLRQTGIENDVS
jgi:hypothetical protein